MTALYLLEPDRPGAAWAPFAGVAPLCELRAGGWRLRDRWARALDATPTGVLAAHAAGPRPGAAIPVVDGPSVRGPGWVADATFAPRLPMRASASAKRLICEGRSVAWRLDQGEPWRGPHTHGDGLVIDGMPLRGAWDLLTVLEQYLFPDTLAELERGSDPLPSGAVVIGNEGAVSLRDAEIEPGVVLDVRKGAVILERGVTVRSGSRLEGPCWIGAHGVVSGGQLRHVSAGPGCRLHGEIASTVFSGHANKSHDGFVGHSIIGEWVNLGAGTITSNLKNTYGPVRLDIDSARIDTGRQLLGSLVGDHVKTAIGTLLPTGAVIGVGANLFGSVRAAKYTPPFAWGDSGESLALERFVEVARRVMPRRKVEVDDAMEAALRAMFLRVRGGA
jgi:UDP-N-acetylglucosamine diphosphorylase/glucosamine-1-phosphate N-acetyltransferase